MLGTPTSDIEVSGISPHGLWLYVKGKEYFLSYIEYPWFENARVKDIHNVLLQHDSHLNWPDLDVDLALSSLQNPDNYPLLYR